MEKYIITVLPMIISLLGTSFVLCFLIPVLKSKKMGQKILDIGPRWHKDKEGTPTMGGIAFLVVITVTAVSFLTGLYLNGTASRTAFLGMLLTSLYALMNGFIGVTDDLKKFKKKQNEGLTAKEKYLLQLLISLAYVILLIRLGAADTSLYIPFLGRTFELGVLWYPFALLFLTGFGNAVNLTDGIDGLCGSVSAAAAVFFTAYCLMEGAVGGTVISSALFGGCLGFLVYNIHPARVFMGDTGSLFLGGLISGTALALKNPLLLFFVGIVYLLEAASVVIQVIFFKFTGKRVFLMAPLHHHFEKKGLSEGKITLLAVLLTVLFSLIAFFFR